MNRCSAQLVAHIQVRANSDNFLAKFVLESHLLVHVPRQVAVEGRGEAAPEVPPQSLHGKAFERVDLGNHARRVPLVRVFPEFAHCELHGLVGRGKVSEQIRELRNRQELVLGHP